MTAPVADGTSDTRPARWRAGLAILSGRAARPARALIAALALLALLGGGAPAEETRALKGVALVIGETQYAHLGALANPAHDARSIKTLLDRLGFDARDAVNRDARTLRRDLDRFAEDAAGADVALIYYSGHGIEAGGENWLVPVDADLTALDKAQDRLIPLSAYLRRLQQSVPFTILLLDACRTSPFPPGASLRPSPADRPVPVGAQGLAGTAKGVSVIEPEATPQSESGTATVLGFAAAPGDVALDGPKDGNSPYAKALLKHLAAKGLDFGDVMTLVSQEVYVETGGRQVPWTNHNLRQFLYFGLAAESDAGEEASIRGERRKLLLAIASTPEDRKRLVETLARADAVPLDALYGMLNLLEPGGAKDAADLDRRLREGAEKLKGFLAERRALKSEDPELTRLSALADEALDQGAIRTAIALHEKAKTRIGQLSPAVEQAKADVMAREIEFAQVYAASGRTNILAFDHRKAAADFKAAHEKAKTWDTGLAFAYKLAEAGALKDHGDFKGDDAALQQAIAAYDEALALAPRARAPLDWAKAQNNLGLALESLGGRERGPARLEQALAAYGAALEERSRARAPVDWARTQANIGNALSRLAQRESGMARLDAAAAAYQAALEEITRARLPLEWAVIQNNLGSVLEMLGERGDAARLHEALAAHRAAAEEMTRERMPLTWAKIMEDLGNALQTLAQDESGTERLDESVTAYELALEEITRQRMPFAWARIQGNLGNALSVLGERENDPARLEAAVAAYRAALMARPRAQAPIEWASTQNNLGAALKALGERESGTARLSEAVAAYRAALEEKSNGPLPRSRAMSENNLAAALMALGRRTGSRETIEEARARLASSWDIYKSLGEDRYDAYFAGQLAEIDGALGKLAPAAGP